MLFALWQGFLHRRTRDLDLLGFGDPAPESVTAVFKEIVTQSVPVDDGILFNAATVEAATIKSQDEYVGARVKLCAFIGIARIWLQVDVRSPSHHLQVKAAASFLYKVLDKTNPSVSRFPSLLEEPPHLRRERGIGFCSIEPAQLLAHIRRATHREFLRDPFLRDRRPFPKQLREGQLLRSGSFHA